MAFQALIPYALAAYGGYKGYQASKDAGGSGLQRLLAGATGAKKTMSNLENQLIYESILEQVLEEYPELTGIEQARLADEIFLDSSDKFSWESLIN